MNADLQRSFLYGWSNALVRPHVKDVVIAGERWREWRDPTIDMPWIISQAPMKKKLQGEGQFLDHDGVLYHFDWFGRHASQGLWSWPNSVTCPASQPLWPTTFGGSKKMVKKGFKKDVYGCGLYATFFLLICLRINEKYTWGSNAKI